MRKWMLIFISASLYYSGLIKFARGWILGSGKRLIILNYHCASGGNLRHHLLYLRRHFRILHLETALQELYTPCTKGLYIKDWRPPLVVTFDDGYLDNYTHGFALACELQIPITIFLIPGYVETDDSFWWMDRLIRHTRVNKVELVGCTYFLNQQEERKVLAQTITNSIKHMSSAVEREELLNSVRKTLDIPSSIVIKERPMPLLSWKEIQEMQESGWVSFGAHSMHHPILGNLTNFNEMQREVGECRTVLEQRLGTPVHVFAFPYGKPKQIGDYGTRVVQQGGYDWAVTTTPGFATSRSNPYLLPRIFCDVDQHWLVIAAKTSGLWQLLTVAYGWIKSKNKMS